MSYIKDTDYKVLIENLKTSEDKERAKIIDTLSKNYTLALPLLWKESLENENPRAMLSAIRDIIKKEKPREMLKRNIGSSKEKLKSFLQSPDAKTRKNTCGIISELADPAYLSALYTAFEKEDQLFVKSSYILAIGNCGKASDGEKLEKILESLISNEKACRDESELIKNAKHLNEEKLVLGRAIAKLSKCVRHKFKGFEEPVPMLVTAMNKEFRVTLNELKEKSIKGNLVDNGILIKEKDLDKIYSCRTFYELLYPLDSLEKLEFNSDIIASAILKANIIDFLNSCHENASIPDDYFPYRIELKTESYNKERSDFLKSLSIKLDELSNGKLKNSPSSYEVEIRIVEKNNICSVFIKLYSFKDTRFDYRENTLASSINPVTAAIVVKSIEKWLKNDSKVLDPFCGTSTMLIERAKLKETSSLTGIDIFGAAIDFSKVNSRLSNTKIKLINEDILSYKTFDVFDEIICNMPFEANVGSKNHTIDLYRGFIDMIPKLVKPNGMVFLYTVEKNLLKQNLSGNNHLELLDEIKIESGGLTPNVFVLRVK
ncbi:RNA methylase [Clostridium putrefaciens]|uniref:RNA methylase n=1 Tax=Clostridium putrefaciens TaxID=99675 RepID=A0A381J8P4_9CLOT|nr:methyltransferase domain-containing protein [Clostridium putrefaciens]SUY47581.1 RNA methylase [Clostridium putrefaciens]